MSSETGYRDLFLRVADHVRWRGLEAELTFGCALTDATVEEARRRLSLPLPGSLVEFYRETGDGMLFRWSVGGLDDDDDDDPEADDEADYQPFAMVAFRPLLDVVAAHEEDKTRLTEFRDDYDYPHTDDPALAKRTALRMGRWLGFHDEGNGDRFCLDTAVNPEPVVFDQHDWLDGGTGDNGAPMGTTLLAFMEDWARVCFQIPSSLWWPSVLTPSGINLGERQVRPPLLPEGPDRPPATSAVSPLTPAFTLFNSAAPGRRRRH